MWSIGLGFPGASAPLTVRSRDKPEESADKPEDKPEEAAAARVPLLSAAPCGAALDPTAHGRTLDTAR